MTILTGNVKSFLSLHILFIKCLGLWATPEKYGCFYNFYRVLIFILQYSIILFVLIYLGKVWGDLEAVSEGLYILFTQLSTSLKMMTILNKKTLNEILELMNSDIFMPLSSEHETILKEQSRKTKNLFLTLFTVLTLNCIEWCCTPLIIRSGARVYPFTMWMPGDPQKSPDYQLGYVYQVLFAFLGTYTFITIDAFAIAMITFGCAQIDIIKDKVAKIQNVPFDLMNTERDQLTFENNKLFNECVRQHQAVIKFVTLVERMFNTNIFFQFTGSVGIVCMIAFRITVKPMTSFELISTIGYMFSILAQLYFYCWIGNELTTRSEDLRDFLYQCPWYDQDIKFQKKLCYALESMKKPIVFKAGHYISLSRPMFVSILRCSYSYFAVLNQANST